MTASCGVVAADKPCRSSLECGHGLRCLGVGPTDMGKRSML
ncbi:hypothetical protein [Polyangium jinanense]|nr:hypothetical protein [Polyangium jinanense]